MGHDRLGRHTLLVLSRHAQTVWHRENRYAGVSDIDLTDVGREQARLLADWAGRHRPDRLVCSPLRRARQTAGPVGALLGLEPVVIDDLREIDFGTAEGRTIEEIDAVDPDLAARFSADPVRNYFPGGESPIAAARRASTVLRSIAAHDVGGRVLVVAHSSLLRLAICDLVGIPLPTYRAVFPYLDNATLTTMAMPAGGTHPPALLSYNVPLSAGAGL